MKNPWFKGKFSTPIGLYSGVLLLLSLGYLLLPFELNTALGWHILKQIKLPILMTAVFVGFAICSASAVLQILLKNPLADPGIIGVSSGASASAALYFLLIGSGFFNASFFLSPAVLSLTLPIMCFLGALMSGFFIYQLAKKLGFEPGAVILAGIAISTLLAAFVAWLFLYLPPSQLQNLSFWLMGSLNNTNTLSLSLATPFIIIPLLIIYKSTEALNYFYFGKEVAALKGLAIQSFQTRILLCIAVLVGTAVSLAGSIAFIGLIIPHLLRQMHEFDNRLIVPLSGICGAIILVLCAIVSEWAVQAQIPISLLTASIGAPIFIYLLYKGRAVNVWQSAK